jgi:hypothetical protein
LRELRSRFRSAGVGKARQAEEFEREVRKRSLELTRLELRKRVHSSFATALYQDKAFATQTAIIVIVAASKKRAERSTQQKRVPGRSKMIWVQDWATAELAYLESVRDVMQAWAELRPYLDSSLPGEGNWK